MWKLLCGLGMFLCVMSGPVAWASVEKQVGDPCQISWDANSESDLSHYLVHANEAQTQTSTTGKDCVSAGANAVGTYDIFVEAVDQSGNVSDPSIVVQLILTEGDTNPPDPPDPPDPPPINASWEASRQIPDGTWKNSDWDQRSFRVLLQGSTIVEAGEFVKVKVRNRSGGSYQFARLSLVPREGETLNGNDDKLSRVTFGGVWDQVIDVPQGEAVVSDAMPFDLVKGQDVFATFWVPTGQPTVYLDTGGQTYAWIVKDNDLSQTVDWEGILLTDTRTHMYMVAEVAVTEAPVSSKDMVLCEIEERDGGFTLDCEEVQP